jgi:hypothetical protein
MATYLSQTFLFGTLCLFSKFNVGILMPRPSHLAFRRQPHDALPKSAAFAQADTIRGRLRNYCLYEFAG